MCLHKIVSACIEHNIPYELVIDVDQTPSKYVATDKITMAEKNSRHVSKQGAGDKRQITATFAETLAGDVLPLQLIYKGKTKRSLPSVTFPDGFLLSVNERHWRNEEETLKYIDRVINSYLASKKEELGLPPTQRSLLVWDAFSDQDTDAVKEKVHVSHIEVAQVPKNMTHLLHQLDLTTRT